MSETLATRFFQRSQRRAGRLALTYGERRVTFGEWSEASRKLGAALRSKGLCGGNIGIFLPNLPEYAFAFFGVLDSDNTIVPINFLLQREEIATIVRHSQMKAILTLAPFAERLEPAGKDGPEILDVSELLRATGDEAIPPSCEPQNQVAMILYTSGTTGDPKGVMLSHANVLSNCDAYAAAFGFSPRGEFVGVLPLFHTFAITTNLLAAAYVGCSLYLVSRFQPKPVYDLLRSLRRAVLIAVPSMFNLLSRLPGEDSLDGVRLVVSGGAPLPPEVQDAFKKRFGIEILEGYGLTEASPAVCANVPGQNRQGTIGPPLPGVQVQVWDAHDRSLAPGEPGELMVKGPNIMLGYYRNPQATSQTLAPGGWLRTGDLATIDKDGYVRIVGRKKELIISAGRNIYPREIEDVLQQHPQVFEVAVVPARDPLRGEVPRAVLTPVEGETLDFEQLRAYCRCRLAEYKIPRFFEVLPSLPKTSTGKIMKKVLIEQSQLEK